MSNWNWVMLAFGLTWVVLAGYTIFVNGRVRRAQDALREALQSTGAER